MIKEHDEKLLMIAFFLLVIGWSLDMFVHFVPTWISWGIMVVGVILAVIHKIKKNNRERKNGTYQK